MVAANAGMCETAARMKCEIVDLTQLHTQRLLIDQSFYLVRIVLGGLKGCWQYLFVDTQLVYTAKVDFVIVLYSELGVVVHKT